MHNRSVKFHAHPCWQPFTGPPVDPAAVTHLSEDSLHNGGCQAVVPV